MDWGEGGVGRRQGRQVDSSINRRHFPAQFCKIERDTEGTPTQSQSSRSRQRDNRNEAETGKWISLSEISLANSERLEVLSQPSLLQSHIRRWVLQTDLLLLNRLSRSRVRYTFPPLSPACSPALGSPNNLAPISLTDNRTGKTITVPIENNSIPATAFKKLNKVKRDRGERAEDEIEVSRLHAAFRSHRSTRGHVSNGTPS